MAARPVKRHAIAVDLGGTQIRVGLVDTEGNVTNRLAQHTMAQSGPDFVIEQIAGMVGQVSARRDQIEGVGVSSPGPIDTREGITLGIATLAGFENVPLRQRLSERLNREVQLENDGIAAAIGEWTFGAGVECDSIVYVTVSTGLGGGVIANRHILRGRRGMAGHIGHMVFERNGLVCGCGNTGCFEAYASATAFAARAQKAMKRDALDAVAVFSAARAGDKTAQNLVADHAAILGKGFASLAHLYSPDMIIVGGGMSNQFDMLRDGITGAFRAGAMPPFRETRIVRAELGDNAGLVGAAMLVLRPELRG
jgi:glucokinase